MITVSAKHTQKLYDALNISSDKRVMEDLVIVSKKEWSAIQETEYLNSIPGMREKLLSGKDTPKEERVEIDWVNEL
jgi:PHD/YefM family antitoxin component YafN of YafNO toxin-antitoxin module